MDALQILVYSRKGCCLCEGLEQRLQKLKLEMFSPRLELSVIDIDHEGISESLRTRYDLEVPVIVLVLKSPTKLVELPRVSPRLKGDGLARWLQKACTKAIESG